MVAATAATGRPQPAIGENPYSSLVRRRRAAIALAGRRAAFGVEPRLPGRAGRAGGAAWRGRGASAVRSRSASRSRAIARLRVWLRSSWATTRTVPRRRAATQPPPAARISRRRVRVGDRQRGRTRLDPGGARIHMLATGAAAAGKPEREFSLRDLPAPTPYHATATATIARRHFGAADGAPSSLGIGTIARTLRSPSSPANPGRPDGRGTAPSPCRSRPAPTLACRSRLDPRASPSH